MFRDVDINILYADIRVFLADHHTRPQQRRFFRAQSFSATHLVDVIGKGEQLDLVSDVVCGECSGKKRQAVEAQSLRPRETVAFRLSGRISGDAPRMDDSVRQ